MINYIKRCCWTLILCLSISFLILPAVYSQNENPVSSHEIILQIEDYYSQGKESFSQGEFLTAIAKFNQVIELEKDFAVIYTLYAKKYIKLAKEEIARQEQKEIAEFENKKKDSSSPRQSQSVSADSLPESNEYTIGEGDLLSVSVWQEPDLSQDTYVRPDGKISLSLAGDIPVVGLTFTELKKEITRRLEEYIRQPVVSLSLKEMGGKKIIVLGEVKSPGIYFISGMGGGILEAIAEAGGFTKDAVPKSVILIRGGLEHPEGRRLNLTKALRKADVRYNIALQPQDIVYVPKRFISRVNYYVSQILDPLYKGTFTFSEIEEL